MRRLVQLALASTVPLAVLVAAPGAAHAYASLEASTPASNSVLEESPTQIVLDFDDAVEVAAASIELFDGNGEPVAVGAPARGGDASQLTASMPTLDDGLYAVIWRVTSGDGHPIDGAFSFQIGTRGAGDGAELIARVGGGVESPPSVRWMYGIGRFLSLLGAILTIGAGCWLFYGARDRAWVGRFLVAAASFFVVGTLITFGFFGAHAAAGGIGGAFDPTVWVEVASLATGRALLLRAALAAATLLLAIVWARRQRSWWRAASATVSVVVLATFPLSGHPNALAPRALWLAVDYVHLAAVGGWVGGLIALLLVREQALASQFSRAAAVFVPMIVVTGVLQVWKLADGFDDVAATDWGRVLLVKLTVVVVLLAFAAVSRWLLLHDGVASIRRTVVAEAALGVVVLGLAAGMVALPPMEQATARPFAAQLASSGLIVEVSGGPGLVGLNEVHLVITPPGGSLQPVIAVVARVLLESEGIPPAPVDLVRESGSHYSGTVAFPQAGEWTLEVIVQATAEQTVLLTTTITVR